MRELSGCAAHAGQAARARATSASTLLMGPDQRVAPVAGSVDINLAAMDIRNDYAAEHVLMLSANFTWGQLFVAGSQRDLCHYVQAARCASPISRMAAIFALKGCQSSRWAIADQIASTSSICMEQGSLLAQ